MNEIKVKELREGKGMTQAQLAQMMGVSIQTVKNWEAGKTIPSTARMKLQDIFCGDCSNVANNVTGDNIQNSGKVIDVLSHQLDEKDRQIGRLLSIIENLSK